MESYCLLCVEFQLYLMKELWRWVVVMVIQHYECI